MALSPPLKNIQGLIAIGSSFNNRSSYSNIFICGLRSSEECFSTTIVIIDGINGPLSLKCSVSNFYLEIKVMDEH